ncbi:MAG: MFS transporter [Candidatus Harrisonbacteria bacterium]|nr:MFS transporter [Candidatus Harrisonbacteria bacterium]
MNLNITFNAHISRFIKKFIIADVFLWAGWGFVDPIFSVFIVRNIAGATLVTVGIAVALYWSVKSLLQIPLAIYLDKTDGERDDFYALIASLVIVGLAAFGFSLATRVWHIYFVQLVKAVGFALYVPSFSSLFAGHLDKRHRSLDYALDSTSVGFAMGATGLLGGVMATWLGYGSVFVFAGIFAFLSAALLLSVPHLVLPERAKKPGMPILKDHEQTTVER